MDYARVKVENENLKVKVQILEQNHSTARADLDRQITDFKNLLKRTEDDRKSNGEKFAELFTSRNETKETLVELSATVKSLVANITQQYQNLEKKFDELKQELKEKTKGQ